MTYVVGIDVGTSGTKVTMYDIQGNIMANATRSYPMIQNQEGHAEQNPEDWVEATLNGLAEVANHGRDHISDIQAIGITGQMHGLVMLDEKNEVLRPSIIWCDQRTAPQVAKMESTLAHDVWLEITGNKPGTGLTLAKLLWVKEQEPHVYEACRTILLPKDYVRYRLSGVLATDLTDASGTQMLALESGKWSESICSILDIDMTKLPHIHPSTAQLGSLTEACSLKTGLPAGTPIIAGAADQPASAIGNGVIRAGVMSDTLGSSGVLFMQTDGFLFDPYGRINTFRHVIPDSFAVMGVTQGCGISMQWMIDRLYQNEKHPFAVMNADVAKARPDNALYFLPYLMGERTPIVDANAKGMLFGITGQTTTAAIARAVMEGISFSQLHAYKVFEALAQTATNILLGGGGANSRTWTQMMSDVFNLNIQTHRDSGTTTLGAAIIAAVGAGLFPSWQDAVDSMIHIEEEIQPVQEVHDIYQRKFIVYKQLYEATKHLM